MTLYYHERFNLAQIATAIGVSRSRASQIYTSCVLNLRARLADPIGKGESTIHVCARPPTNGSRTGKKTVRHPKTSGDELG